MTGAVTITHTHETGSLVSGTSRGDGSAEILKGFGWKWGRSIDVWYLPMSRDRLPKTYLIERTAAELRNAGFEVTVTVEVLFRATVDVEADKISRQADRTAALEAKAER
jgi:hypothetical protein